MSSTSKRSRTARDHAQELGEQAKTTASQEASARAEQAKEAAAINVEETSGPAAMQAQALRQLADQIVHMSEKLRTADVGQLVAKSSDVARRNPMLLVGGAAVAGFAIARFFKARDPETTAWDVNDDPWSPRRNPTTADGAVMSDLNREQTDA
ncbi:hypothetical protein [Yoonia algicola]|uniref:DUF3618 domain-containing protein n=1 Tax=Yoonia algicola TaxID=3137368 RepID=A0AAN0NGT0_9RHOB